MIYVNIIIHCQYKKIIYCLFMVLSVIVCLNILGISSLPPEFSCTHLPPHHPVPIWSVISFVIDWFSAIISALFVHVCCHVDVNVICNVLMCQ